MANFEDRFGGIGEIPNDPIEREQFVRALRARMLEPLPRGSKNTLDAMAGGRSWSVPPEADWRHEPDDSTPVPSSAPGKLPRLPSAVGNAMNQASGAEMAGAGTPDQTQPAPEPAWLVQGRADEARERAKTDPIGPRRPEIGQGEAVVRGLQQGGTFGWMDEIRGLRAASGLPAAGSYIPVVGPALDAARTAIGGVRMALGNKDATQAYDETTGLERFRGNTARQQHPVTSTVAEIAGGAAVPIPGGVGRTLLGTVGRQALAGAGTGVLQSLGESEDKGAKDVLLGGGIGATLGATLPLAGRLVSMVGAAPINFVRNAWNPQGGAERAVAGAWQEAERAGARARAAGLPEEPRAARSQVTPGGEATVMDTLGTPGRDLGRAASNISTEAHADLTGQLGARSQQRTVRNDEFINRESNYPNPRAQQEAIATAAEELNTPNYRRAMVEGNFDLAAGNTGAQGLNRLIERSPAVQRAAREAEQALADKYAGQGRAWDGFHNLEYWDQVKRQLDQQVNQAESRGLTTDTARLTRIKDALVERLDTQVPSYAQARDVASTYFGQRDALQAGQAFFGDRRRVDQSLHAFSQMGDTQKQLFRDGLMDRVRQQARSDQNFWTKYDRNAGDIRTKLQGVLPPDQLNRLEAHGTLERIMQESSNAIRGNSSTARQLTQLGLATAAGAGANYGSGEGTHGELLRGGGAAVISMLAKRHVDQQVATRIAQVLLSKDPAVIERAATAFARSEPYMNALRILRSQLSGSVTREAASTPSRGEQR